MTPFSQLAAAGGRGIRRHGGGLRARVLAQVSPLAARERQVVALVRVAVLGCRRSSIATQLAPLTALSRACLTTSASRSGRRSKCRRPDDGAQAERVNFITAVVMPFLMVAFGVIVILFWSGVTRS